VEPPLAGRRGKWGNRGGKNHYSLSSKIPCGPPHHEVEMAGLQPINSRENSTK